MIELYELQTFPGYDVRERVVIMLMLDKFKNKSTKI